MSYSVDLRNKELEFIERTKNMLEASRVFGINYNTVRKWFKVYEEEGRIEPKEPNPLGYCSTPKMDCVN